MAVRCSVRISKSSRVGIITDLVNQIIVEGGVIQAEWELRSVVNGYKGKRNSLERRN